MPDGVTIPGGPSFGGYPQPPDVPCDPTGDGWRGPPGPVGPQGPPGSLNGGTMTGPLNWTSTGTTTSRAAQDRSAEVISLRDFGAAFDGVTDDLPAWTALNARLAGMTTGGLRVLVPTGRSVLSAAVSITLAANVGLTIEGAGKDMSELVFTGTTSGFTVTMNGDANHLRNPVAGQQGNPLTLRGLAIKQGNSGGGAFNGTGLTINGNGVMGRAPATVKLSDMRFNGTANGYSWARAMVMNAVNLPVIDDVIILFANSDHTAGHGVGLTYNGVSASVYATTLMLNNFTCSYGYAAVMLDPYVQGFTASGINSIAQDYGIYQADVVSTGAPELISISQGYFYNAARGIYLGKNSAINAITNCLMQAWGSPAVDWAGIECSGANSISIAATNIQGLSQPNTHAFKFTNAGGIISVVGGTVSGLTGYVIDIQSTTSQIVVSGVSANCPSGLGFVHAANTGQILGTYQYNAVAYLLPTTTVDINGNPHFTSLNASSNVNVGGGVFGYAVNAQVVLGAQSGGAAGTPLIDFHSSGNATSDSRLLAQSGTGATDGTLEFFGGVLSLVSPAGLRVGGNVGFYNSGPVAKQTLTGAKGGNAALASVIAGLVALGLFTDTTTA
jgi:hypothetical protein